MSKFKSNYIDSLNNASKKKTGGSASECQAKTALENPPVIPPSPVLPGDSAQFEINPPASFHQPLNLIPELQNIAVIPNHVGNFDPQLQVGFAQGGAKRRKK